jgi:hypothetical protein
VATQVGLALLVRQVEQNVMDAKVFYQRAVYLENKVMKYLKVLKKKIFVSKLVSLVRLITL